MIAAERRVGRTASRGGLAGLVALLAIGAALRLYNINWDQFHELHPDERAIAMAATALALPLPPDWANLLDPRASTLNPHFFAYGSLTMYLLRLASTLAGLVNSLWGEYEYINLVGRALSAAFDLGSIALVYALGSRLYGRRVGLLAAAFVTFTAFQVQLSHFYAADTPLTFFVLLALVLAERCLRRGGLGNAALLGAALGLALSFKVSAAPALLLPPVAWGLRLLWPDESGRRWRRPGGREALHALAAVAASLATAALVALVCQPYALIDFNSYVAELADQNAMAHGAWDVPYTRQYVDTVPYLYQLRNLVQWAYGPPLGLAALAGWLYVMLRAVTRPRRADLLLLAWVVPYFLITGGFYAKFLRYMLPIMPFLSLFAAVALGDLYRHLAARRRAALASAGRRPGEDADVAGAGRGRHRLAGLAARGAPALAVVLSGLALLGGVLYTAAFMNVYASEHPRLAASRWIYENVPAGATIATEHWDDVLPLPVVENGHLADLGKYHQLEMPLYDPDNVLKVGKIVDALERADYVVLSSNRLYRSIPRWPERYPITSRYYELLFAGKLGFTLERTFAVYPSLGGWSLVDDDADESFTVYDHPKVLVFHKTADLSATEMGDLLAPLGVAPGDGVLPEQLMARDARDANRNGGTYAALFDPSAIVNRAPVFWWALAVAALGLLALPLAVAAFRWLPDRGYLLAKPLGLLLLAWLQWLLVSLGFLPATRLTLWLVLALLAVLSAAVAWRWRADLAALWRERREALLVGEALFWLAFLAFVGVRLLNPDLWQAARGGEKPMDFAFLMAAVKSENYPPYDPWFAGGYLNYYYFGQIIVATLVKLTGIVPTVAYNLAVPLLFAATAGGAFSAGYNLFARLVPGAGRRALATGLLAAVLVCLAGNLGGALQLLGDVASSLPIGPDWYWASSRVYPDPSVNEFPFFTFLFADLHAHMIALPYALVALGAALNLALGRSGPLGLAGGARRDWAAAALRWGLYGVVLGALPTINFWDFPTYLALVAFAMLAVWYQSKRAIVSLLALLAEVVALGLTAYALYLPFHIHFQSFYFGLDPAPQVSPLGGYLVIHGLFVFGLASFLVYDLWGRHHRAGWWRTAAVGCRHWRRLGRFFALQRLARRLDRRGLLGLYGLVALAGAGLTLLALGRETTGFLLVLLVLAGWLLLQPERPMAETFLLGLVALGLGLGLFCEVSAIKGDIGRMNTVFKIYLQVWVLWGVATAVALSFLLGRLRQAGRAWAIVWRATLALLLAAVLVYPAVATPVRATDRFSPGGPPTLDGAAYMRYATYDDDGQTLSLSDDLAAIQWLQRNVAGSPVVLEGWAPYYRWGARVSIYTGLPTVIGWDWHEKQQRWGYAAVVDRRVADVQRAYSAADPAEALAVLRYYDVAYVYVGGLERAYYPAAGLAKFDAMVGRDLDLVYNAQGVKIYRVRGAG